MRTLTIPLLMLALLAAPLRAADDKRPNILYILSLIHI